MTVRERLFALRDEKYADFSAHLKTFAEDAELEVMNGRFGPYIKYKGANYKLPKTIKEPAELTYEECMEIVNNPQSASKPARGRRAATRR